MRTAILKVGGSLFDLPDLGPRLQRVLTLIDAEQTLLFPGGGVTADVVREWHSRFGLSEEQSHWLAIHSLDQNALLLSELVPCTPVFYGLVQVAGRRDNRTGVLLPWHFLYSSENGTTDAPPHVWDVTSDTLAAWTAICWPADELVLLKSVPCPVGRAATEAVQAGLVDAYFPGYAGRIPRVSWCCLREDEPRITPWLEDGACVGI
jgi:aspartokinase-like uncharacterized kinase